MVKKRSLKSLLNWRELISYGIFGVATTIVNIVLYQCFLFFIDYKVSNLIAIVGAKLFAYFVNKKFVFHSKCANMKELCNEIIRFIVTRGFTGVIDYFGVIFLVEVVQCDKSYSKYIIQVVVIILNYIFGKKMVFNKKRNQNIYTNEGEQK